MSRRQPGCREAGQCSGDFGCPEAGSVDHQCPEAQALAAADLEDEARRRQRSAAQRALQGEHGAVAFGVAEQRQHQAVAVDDAGGGREERRGAREFRFERLRFSSAQPAQAVTPLE